MREARTEKDDSTMNTETKAPGAASIGPAAAPANVPPSWTLIPPDPFRSIRPDVREPMHPEARNTKTSVAL